MTIAKQRVRDMRAIPAYTLYNNNYDVHNEGRAIIRRGKVGLRTFYQ